jgi:hypothetical protein
MARTFRTVHHGEDKLGLAALLEAFAYDQWLGEHYTDEQAAEALMERPRCLQSPNYEHPPSHLHRQKY